MYKIRKNEKKGLKHLRQLIEDALDDIDNWEENEHTSIKQNIYLIQENINLWKMNTTEDSDDENY